MTSQPAILHALAGIGTWLRAADVQGVPPGVAGGARPRACFGLAG